MLPKVFPSMSELVVEPQSDDPRGVVAMTMILYASENRSGEEKRGEERRRNGSFENVSTKGDFPEGVGVGALTF